MRGGRRSIISLLAAAATVIAAACAPPPTESPTPAGSPTQPAARPGAATAPTLADNERLARQEALRLIGLARVPGHSTRLRHAPHGLNGPVEESAVSSQLDQHGFWTVRLPFETALAFVKAHPPVGLSGDGNNFGLHGPGLLVDEFVYDTATAEWGSGRYEISLSRLGPDNTGIRVDAVVTWLDPRPERDTFAGPRLRVTVDTACPTGDEGIVGVRSPGGLTDRLVPVAEPTGARICWYAGGNPAPGFSLVHQAVRSAGPARAIAAAAAAVPLTHDDGGAISCPFDSGQAIAIALHYPERADVDLWYRTTGCSSLANGDIFAFAFTVGTGLSDLGR